MPTFSAIIPLYNHERYIAAAVQSLLEQELCPREIIIVDDGSTDGSRSIAADLAAGHQEIILWHQPNQGAHQAINAGIHRATGDVVAILNSDDMHHPERFKVCGEILAQRPDISAICTGMSFMDGAGHPIDFPWHDQATAFYEQCRDLPLALINGNFLMTTSNLVIRRDVFASIGYFAPLRYAHDLDFFLRLLAAHRQIFLVEDRLLTYRLHGRNTIKEAQANIRVEWAFAAARFLHSIWASPLWRTRGRHYTRRILDVLEAHRLQKIVLMFLSAFRAEEGPGDLAVSLADNPLFLDMLQTMAAE